MSRRGRSQVETEVQKGGKQAVSRVLFPTAPPSTKLLGRWWWIISLEPPLPAASSGALLTERDHGQPLFRGPKPWPCSRPGFTEPAPLDAAGALLPHLCTLACAPAGPSAVCFCGTLLTVSRTGRYPASLAIGEPGLSSTRSRTSWSALRKDRASRDHLTCFLVRSLGLAWLGPHQAWGVHGGLVLPGPVSPLIREVETKVLEDHGAVAQPDRATVS